MRERVVVAMSGGVDSSVAAALLVEEGYEVVGVTMEIWPEMSREAVAHKAGCCSLGAVDDARRVAEDLGIPYYVMNLRETFERSVIGYFRSEYLRGRTPNPCIACNRKVKFDVLLERARTLGAAKLATGHHARIDRAEDGSYQLLRAADRRKDQSYVLYNLGQEEMAGVLFPCGAYAKDAIRAKAREMGLVTADKPDSQEICFVSTDYRELIREEGRSAGARFVDTAGRDLGPAPGVAFFTLGQRKGITVPHQEPLFVVDLLPDEGKVVVGTADALMDQAFTVTGLHIVSGREDGPFEAEVQVRSHAAPAPATVTPEEGGRARVDLKRPLRAVTPGQAAVFYRGEACLGGGIVEGVVKARPEALLAGRRPQ